MTLDEMLPLVETLSLEEIEQLQEALAQQAFLIRVKALIKRGREANYPLQRPKQPVTAEAFDQAIASFRAGLSPSQLDDIKAAIDDPDGMATQHAFKP